MDAILYAVRQSDEEPRNHDLEMVGSILMRVMDDLFERIEANMEAAAPKPEPQPGLPPAA